MQRPNDRYQLGPYLHEVLTLAFLPKDLAPIKHTGIHPVMTQWRWRKHFCVMELADVQTPMVASTNRQEPNNR
jgi:hypothetical protein